MKDLLKDFKEDRAGQPGPSYQEIKSPLKASPKNPPLAYQHPLLNQVQGKVNGLGSFEG